jgi:hypothetical protein
VRLAARLDVPRPLGERPGLLGERARTLPVTPGVTGQAEVRGDTGTRRGVTGRCGGERRAQVRLGQRELAAAVVQPA